MSNLSFIHKLRLNFDSPEDWPLTKAEEKKKYKVMFITQLCINNPLDKKVKLYKDFEMHMQTIKGYKKISYQHFCNLVALAETFIGNTSASDKAYYRYLITEQAKEGLERLKGDTTVKGELARTKYLDIIGKYNLVDKEDENKIPFEDIIPMSVEFTTDVSILGKEPMSDTEIKAARRKWYKKVGLEKMTDDVTDIEYEEYESKEERPSLPK